MSRERSGSFIDITSFDSDPSLLSSFHESDALFDLPSYSSGVPSSSMKKTTTDDKKGESKVSLESKKKSPKAVSKEQRSEQQDEPRRSEEKKKATADVVSPTEEEKEPVKSSSNSKPPSPSSTTSNSSKSLTSSTEPPVSSDHAASSAPASTSSEPLPLQDDNNLASVNGLADNDGQTALHKACYDSDAQLVQALLKAPHKSWLEPSLLNYRDKNGWTALVSASASSSDDRATKILSLLKAGADATIASKNGSAALHYLARAPVPKKGAKDFLKAVKQLLDAGAPLTPNGAGETPLHRAATVGNLAVVQALLTASNMPINAQTSAMRWTALHFAAKHGHREVAAAIIAKGADYTLKGIALDRNGKQQELKASEIADPPWKEEGRPK